MKHPTLPDPIRRHYHWIMAAAVFLAFFVSQGLENTSFSLHLVPVTEELGFSRSAMSTAHSAMYVCAMLSNLMFAFVYRRLGYRRAYCCATILTALSYLMLSHARGLPLFFLGYAMIGLGKSFWSGTSVSRIISEWFHAHRGLVLGVVMSASTLGASFFAMAMSGVISRSGWRIAMRTSTVILLMTAAVVFLLARDTPAKVGLRPLGEGRKIHDKQKKRQENSWYGFSFRFLRKRYYFYCILLGFFLVTLVNTSVLPMLLPHLQSQGFTPQQAATLYSSVHLLVSVNKLVEGSLCDRFGSRPIILCAVASSVVGTLILTLSHTYILSMAGVLFLSFGLVITTIPMPLLITDLFGYRDFSLLLGVINSTFSASGILAGPIVNLVFDRTGSYVPAFLTVILLVIVGAMLFLVTFRGADRDRRTMEPEA